MKKLIALLLLSSLLLSSCDAEVQSALDYAHSAASEAVAATPSVTQSPSPDPEEYDPTVYKPEKDMTIEETVEAYFEQQYLSYTMLMDIDLSSIVDMRSTTNQNMVRWMTLLTQRRMLALESEFCYVETEEFPYSIEFEEEAEDSRMQIWGRRLTELDATMVHFRITGEEGKAYPPIMAVNSQHSMMFRQVDGVWMIASHYFPGSRRKFGTGTVVSLDDDEMQMSLSFEFEPPYETESFMATELDKDDQQINTSSEPAPPDAAQALTIPAGAREYDAEAAVAYALQYTEVKNPDFYDIGDWIGNCANFVSQSVWAGFGADKVTGEWYDGSPAWNHVGYFWDYITSGRGFGAQVLTSVSELQNGDIIQTRPLTMVEEPDRFTHELIVVDAETLMLAQNTPAAFVYYADLVNMQTRMVRPVYLQ